MSQEFPSTPGSPGSIVIVGEEKVVNIEEICDESFDEVPVLQLTDRTVNVPKLRTCEVEYSVNESYQDSCTEVTPRVAVYRRREGTASFHESSVSSSSYSAEVVVDPGVEVQQTARTVSCEVECSVSESYQGTCTEVTPRVDVYRRREGTASFHESSVSSSSGMCTVSVPKLRTSEVESSSYRHSCTEVPPRVVVYQNRRRERTASCLESSVSSSSAEVVLDPGVEVTTEISEYEYYSDSEVSDAEMVHRTSVAYESVGRCIPLPVEEIINSCFVIPRIRPKYEVVEIPLHLPRFIEAPVPAEMVSEEMTATAAHISRHMNSVTANLTSRPAVGLCEIESLGSAVRAAEFSRMVEEMNSKGNTADILNSWKAGKLRLDN